MSAIFSVTTTVNVPRVIKGYQVAAAATKVFHNRDVEFLVVGDRRQPDELAPFCVDAGVRFLDEAGQRALGYECSDLIGWSKIQRRDIGFLEALKSGAEWVHSFDDDNIPVSNLYFTEMLAGANFETGLEIVSKSRWLDPGEYLRPKSRQRGFPYNVKSEPTYGGTVNPKVGVVAGTCILDPDIDAATRMAVGPEVHHASLLVHAGYVVNPYTWTIFNSQATMVRREFVPAWFLWTNCGRMDDIYASLLVQRVMRDRGYYVHFGKPFAAQNRNEHNLVTDLRAETDGYESVRKLASVLDALMLPGKSVIGDCRLIWDTLSHADFVPAKTVETAHAFLRDCEKILGK